MATDVPGLAQVVGDAAVLVPPSDPAALAAQISALVKSREHQERLANAAALRAPIFSIESTVSGYIDLYRSLVN